MLTFTTFYCANFTVLNYRVIFRIYVFQKNRKASNNMQEKKKKKEKQFFFIYSPTKVKHHLTCFNNIFSNNELISNRFPVFVTCTHILTCETGF